MQIHQVVIPLEPLSEAGLRDLERQVLDQKNLISQMVVERQVDWRILENKGVRGKVDDTLIRGLVMFLSGTLPTLIEAVKTTYLNIDSSCQKRLEGPS
jgi:predicted DNA-binding protein (UPF0251 family)